MLATCALLLVGQALAQEPPVVETSESPEEETEVAEESLDPADSRIAQLEARIAELEAAEEQARMESLLREAEALAAEAPPPPPPAQVQNNAFNPALTVFGDGFWSVGVHDGELLEESGPWIRSLELDLRADVDPYAKAVAVIAFHQESPFGGHGHEDEHGDDHGDEALSEEEHDDHASWEIAPEEVYIDLVSLPAGFTARVGLFRQPFGMTNRQHPHDLPWTSVPLVIRELLGDEGYTDSGISLSWRPRLDMPVALTATGGALAGSPFDGEGLAPGWIGRGEAFLEIDAFDFSMGTSATGRGTTRLVGGDLMARWKGSSWRSAMVLAEVVTDTRGQAGGFAALQVQPTRPLYVGARVDWMGGELGYEAALSYYTSEFLRVRASLAYEDDTWLAQSQLTFVWGSHPVEPYWVNR